MQRKQRSGLISISSNVKSLNKAQFLQGCQYLSNADSKLAAIIQKYGTDERLMRRSSAMQCLAQSIVGQQISTKAAQAIWKRLQEVLNANITPDALLATTQTTLRTTGLSARKAEYLHAIAHFLNHHRLEDIKDIRSRLLQVRGVGAWTYDMFAIFYLLQPDILPLGDVGLVRAIQRIYFDSKKTHKQNIEKLAEAWRPYRTVATWFLWRVTDDAIICY